MHRGHAAAMILVALGRRQEGEVLQPARRPRPLRRSKKRLDNKEITTIRQVTASRRANDAPPSAPHRQTGQGLSDADRDLGPLHAPAVSSADASNETTWNTFIWSSAYREYAVRRTSIP